MATTRRLQCRDPTLTDEKEDGDLHQFPPVQVRQRPHEGCSKAAAFGNLDMQIRVPDQKTADQLVRAGVALTSGQISRRTDGLDPKAQTLAYILEGEGPFRTTAAIQLARFTI